jgi:hypothetical protein
MSIATSPPRLAAVSPLPDDLLALAPEPVREASADLAAKLARLEAAEVARRDAADAIEQAVADDRDAAVEAAEADKPTPKPKEPKARERAAEAERAEAAMVEVVNAAQRRLLVEVGEAREVIAGAANGELGDLESESAHHVDGLEAALARRRSLLRLLASLGNGERLEGRTAQFQVNPAPRRRRSSDPLAPKDRRVLDELRERLGLA